MLQHFLSLSMGRCEGLCAHCCDEGLLHAEETHGFQWLGTIGNPSHLNRLLNYFQL